MAHLATSYCLVQIHTHTAVPVYKNVSNGSRPSSDGRWLQGWQKWWKWHTELQPDSKCMFITWEKFDRFVLTQWLFLWQVVRIFHRLFLQQVTWQQLFLYQFFVVHTIPHSNPMFHSSVLISLTAMCSYSTDFERYCMRLVCLAYPDRATPSPKGLLQVVNIHFFYGVAT